MAANTSPIFVLTPNVGQCLVTTANTNFDGTGSLVLGFTAGLNGSLIDSIHVAATGAVVNGLVTIFIRQGSTYTLFGAVTVTAASPSATVAPFSADFFPGGLPLSLPTGATLYFGTTITQNLVVISRGGDF